MSVLLLAQSGDLYSWLAPLGVFGLVAALAWMTVDWLSTKSSRAEQRLDDFKDPTARKKRQDLGGR